MKQELLESKDETGIDELFFQKCNEKFGLDLPVHVKNFSLKRPTIEEPHRTPSLSPVPVGELFSEVKPKFIEFWNKRDNKGRTVERYGQTIDHFIEIVGDVPIDSINSKMVFEYKQKYLKIPNRRHQLPKYEGKTIDEILEMNPTEEGRSVYSMNQSIRRLSTITKWCCANTAMTENPFATDTEKNVKKDKIQKNFSDEEIKRLFDPTVYLSSSIFFIGNQPNRHANFFIPLILLFTGARVSEAAQLHISDVYKVRDKKSSSDDTDVWIFDFNSNECECCPPEHRKSIKNQSSHRRIPVHPSLLEIGLIRYRNIIEKKGETRLFPKNNFQTKGGWSGAFSNWWNTTYLPKVGLKNLAGRKTDTHTFRNTCLNKMKSNGVEEGLAMEYAGHHHTSMTFTTYSDKYDPTILIDRVLDKIHYKGLTIEKLKVNWSNIFKNFTKNQLKLIRI